MSRYSRTGRLPELIDKQPSYGDFSSVVDYQEAMNIVKFAEFQFQNLPSNVRDRFGNSPEKFLEFVNNPDNVDEMIKMGLAHKKAETTVPPVPPAAPVVPGTAPVVPENK
jgi:phage internal scaffolding protein